MRRWVGCVIAGLLLAACGGGGETIERTTTTAVETTTTAGSATTTSAAPATSASTTSVLPGSPVTLLVADDTGLRLWSEDGTQEWLIRGRAMQAAVPDRVGGVIYQQVETGIFSMHFGGDYGSAWFAWNGDGTPRPIRRLSGDRTDEVVVAPAAGQTLRIIDSALIDGRPHLAYLRATHVLDQGQVSQTDGWNATRTTELVIRDLTTGEESVTWSLANGWESGSHDSKLGGSGDGAVVDVWIGYAEEPPPTVTLSDVSGSPLAMPYRPPEHRDSCWGGAEHPVDAWCVDGRLRADLAPDGSVLAYTLVEPPGTAGVPSDSMTVATIDPATWVELVRVSVPTAPDVWPTAVDAADGRVLVGMTAMQATAAPTLHRGDTGEWVRLLQTSLMLDDAPLVPDGAFGPRTEAAVREAQQRAGLEPTGVVDSTTWAATILGYSGGATWMQLPKLLVEPDGSVREIDAPGTGAPATDFALGQVTRVTLWDE